MILIDFGSFMSRLQIILRLSVCTEHVEAILFTKLHGFEQVSLYTMRRSIVNQDRETYDSGIEGTY